MRQLRLSARHDFADNADEDFGYPDLMRARAVLESLASGEALQMRPTYTLGMKSALSDKGASTPRSKAKVRPLDGLHFVEVGDGVRGPGNDAKKRLAAFYAKYPLRTLKRGERGIVEGLKADRDRR